MYWAVALNDNSKNQFVNSWLYEQNTIKVLLGGLRGPNKKITPIKEWVFNISFDQDLEL